MVKEEVVLDALHLLILEVIMDIQDLVLVVVEKVILSLMDGVVLGLVVVEYVLFVIN